MNNTPESNRYHGEPTDEDEARWRAHWKEVNQFLAERKGAGRLIDIVTCSYYRMAALALDPYNVRDDVPPQFACLGKTWFVESADSRGPVVLSDLPDEKASALMDRIEIEGELYSAAVKRGIRPPDEQSAVIERFERDFPDEANSIRAAVRQKQNQDHERRRAEAMRSGRNATHLKAV